MRFKKTAKMAVLLLGLVVFTGFAKCAMADGFHHRHHDRQNSLLGINISLGGFRGSHYYYNPYAQRYTYYPDYNSYRMALENYYRAERELARQEKYLRADMHYYPEYYRDRL